MEDLRHTAFAYNKAAKGRLDEPTKAFFEEMDRDNDDRVQFEEFKQYMKTVDCSQFGSKYFFDELKGDKDYLSYGDIITLLYIIHSGRPFCEKCKCFIKGMYFTCVQCFDAEGDYCFNVCPSCYYEGKYQHCHEEFLDPIVLLRLKKKQEIQAGNSSVVDYSNKPSASSASISSSTSIIQKAESMPSSSNAIVERNPQRGIRKGERALQLMQIAVSIGNLVVATSQLCSIM